MQINEILEWPKKRLAALKPVYVLLAFYFLFVVIRFLIGLFTSRNPFIIPDENLYMNLARSIHEGGAVSIRNQPVTFYTLLYSILISPLYGLPASVNLFRVIQFFNTLVMGLSVFPAYKIAERFTKGRGAAFFVAGLTLLLPDMLMASRIMTEALLFPLFLFVIWLVLTVFLDPAGLSPQKASLLGLLAFLLYLSKAGSLALTIPFGLYLLYSAVRERDKKLFTGLAFYAGVFLGAYLIFRLVCIALFQMDPAQPTVFSTYAPKNLLEHLSRVFPGLLLYLFYTIISFGIFPVLLPLSSLREFPAEKRRFIIFTAIALALYAAGACYLFFPSETIGNFHAGRIHIRYLFPFMPLFFAFFLAPELRGKRAGNGLMLGAAYLVAVFATQSFTSLLSGETYCIDALSLSYVTFTQGDFNSRLFTQVVVLTFLIYMVFRLYKNGFGKTELRGAAAFLLTALLLSNAFGYYKCQYNTQNVLSADVAATVSTQGKAETALILTGDAYFENYLSVLDGSLRKAPYCVTLDELCAAMTDNGRLAPLTPIKYWTEAPKNKIPVCQRYIFNGGYVNMAVLADGVTSILSPNGYYLTLQPNADGRLFHSVLVGVGNDGTALNGAGVWLFDKTLLQDGKIKLYIKVKAASAGVLTLSCGDERFDFTIGTDSEWIYGNFAASSTGMKVSITVSTPDIKIMTYSVE